jgi:hypothetical protein
MEAKIIIEKRVENKIYFELIPVSEEYKDLLRFGKEVEYNESELNEIRNQIIQEAESEFDINLNPIPAK